MALSSTFANALAKLIFQGTPIANIADNAAAAPAGRYWISLHTANPGPGGTQATSELAYTEMARRDLVRTAAAWDVQGAVVRPVTAVEFPMMQTAGGGGTVTHFTVGMQQNGAGMYLLRGTVTPPLNIGLGDTPRLLPATTLTLVTADDGV